MGRTLLGSPAMGWSDGFRLHASRSCSPVRNRRTLATSVRLAREPARSQEMARRCGNTSGAVVACLPPSDTVGPEGGGAGKCSKENETRFEFARLSRTPYPKTHRLRIYGYERPT